MMEVLRAVEAPPGLCSTSKLGSHEATCKASAAKQPGAVYPANFIGCLATELQLFDDAELERMQAGLSWLLKQVTLTARMKAKVRALLVIPSNNDEPHITNLATDRAAANGSLTPGDQAAVEAMFRLEGLVNLLYKQLHTEELKKNEQALKKKASSKASTARRKGNKIKEGAVEICKEEAQLEGATNTVAVDKRFESSVQRITKGGIVSAKGEGGRQQNGGEAHLPLNGMIGLTDLSGGGRRTGEASGDPQDAPDGDVRKDPSNSKDDEGNNGDGDGPESGEQGGNGQEPPDEARSTADELAEIRSSLASISRQQKFAHGILVYLLISTTIPAVTLIRWKIRSLRFMNPIKRFQKDMEKNILGKSDDSVIDELLPWKASEPVEPDPLTQQFHMLQEALGGQSEEEAQISVEADLRAARSHARKHWWQIGPLQPQEDPDLLRTRTERAHLKRLAPLRVVLEFFGKIQHAFEHESA